MTKKLSYDAVFSIPVKSKRNYTTHFSSDVFTDVEDTLGVIEIARTSLDLALTDRTLTFLLQLSFGIEPEIAFRNYTTSNAPIRLTKDERAMLDAMSRDVTLQTVKDALTLLSKSEHVKPMKSNIEEQDKQIILDMYDRALRSLSLKSLSNRLTFVRVRPTSDILKTTEMTLGFGDYVKYHMTFTSCIDGTTSYGYRRGLLQFLINHRIKTLKAFRKLVAFGPEKHIHSLCVYNARVGRYDVYGLDYVSDTDIEDALVELGELAV